MALHGMIFAVITGTKCISIDNSNHKIKNTYLSIEQLRFCLDYSLNENTLSLKFNGAYVQMDKSTEVLMRMVITYIKLLRLRAILSISM